MNKFQNKLQKAAELLSASSYTVAFTGAGVSVESGIPPFRGKDGLWNRIDPGFLDIDFFYRNPEESWRLIKEIFYDFFWKAQPNAAHFALAEMEKNGMLQSVITQNIDNLHQRASSRTVYEFHGNSRDLVCGKCGRIVSASTCDLSSPPPLCRKCGTVLKPNFVFFGEPIPEKANAASLDAARTADLFILIGTTGEIMPASMIPYEAKRHGARIIEINTQNSNYTHSITDVFLQGKATAVMTELCNH